MPRQPRFLPPDSVYHIITRSNNQNIIFKDEEDFAYYLDLLAKFKKEHPFDLYHYCLMPTHVHKLLKISKNSEFSKFMKRLNLSYFHHYRQKYGWSGHFWQDRFKSKLVSQDEYLIQCGKYIELNPVRAKIIESPEDYPWSGYRYYSQGKKNELITRDIFYDELGKNDQERQKNYQKMIIRETIYLDNSSLATGPREFVYNVKRKAK